MSNPYINQSQQLLVRVVETLSVDPLRGQSLARLVETTGASRDQIYRALKNLEQAGWAAPASDGWRLAPRVTQLSERLRRAIADVHHTYLEEDTA